MTDFKTLEHGGWTEKASAYDKYFASITRQAIMPLLDALGDVSNRELLDVGCGTGDLAAAAVARGARVTGIDFAQPMIDIARDKVAGAKFHVGDAEALAMSDDTFDIVTCSFGLWHLADPDAAIGEACRVLRPQGTFLYTTWLPPNDGWDMLRLVTTAINNFGSMAIDLPPAPPPFRFADEDEAVQALTQVGFSTPEFARQMAFWYGSSGEELLELIFKAIVRAPMLINGQSPDAQEAIKKDIVANAETLRKEGRIVMRWPYLLASARKS